MSLIKIGSLLLLMLILPGVSSGDRKQEFITVGCTWRLCMYMRQMFISILQNCRREHQLIVTVLSVG